MKLRGKTALVTGAGKGIGQGIAVRLGELGCGVAVNYNSDQKGAERTADAVRAAGSRAAVIQASVADAADVERMFSRTLAEFGRLDILVNNAGIQVCPRCWTFRKKIGTA